MPELFQTVNRFLLPLLAAGVFLLCAVGLLRRPKTGPPPEAFLLNTVNHDRMPLLREENAVGRAKGCDIVLNLGTVSRAHAVIARRRGQWIVCDTGSRGGIKIDGLPVENRAALHHGQYVAFGSYEFLFCDPEEERRLDAQFKDPDRRS